MEVSAKDFSKLIDTPSYVIDESKLIDNLKILKNVEKASGCHILLAQKAYSIYETYPLISKYISGTTASGINEAKLGYEKMGLENHIFSPAYKENEYMDILSMCDHIIFNSIAQWNKYKAVSMEYINSDKNKQSVEFGIRINPQFSTGSTKMYDPCGFGSRFGVKKEDINKLDFDGISGIHFHTLCEQNSDDLERTLEVVIRDFSHLFHKIKWINLGGGHHITREDYDINKLVKNILMLREDYGLEVYLEPGEAVVLNAGYMVSKVLEVVDNNILTAIIDASGACHMPDIIEMPYTPKAMVLQPCNDSSNKSFTQNKMIEIKNMNNTINIIEQNRYRFGGNTCLSGDVFGDYIFEKPIKENDTVIFFDMALYTMVKNNTFNGINLPSIYLYTKDRDLKRLKSFGYEDFISRL